MKRTFSHDSGSRNSEELVKVRMMLGMEGYGVYYAIIEKLAEEEDCVLLKDYNAIAFELRVSSSVVKSVVEDFGLFTFTEDGERFYSEEILTSMSRKDAVSRARAEAGRKGGLAKQANATKTVSNCYDFATDKGENDVENHENVANATESCSNCQANATNVVLQKKEPPEPPLKENIKENPPIGGQKKADEKRPIEERIADFKAMLEPYVPKYGQDVIDDFCGYWTEHGPNDRLFRKEKQTSFDIGRRLGTWVRNNSRWQHRPIVDLTKYAIDWQKVMNWYNSLGLVPIKSISELTDERKMQYVSVYDMYQSPEEFKAALVELKRMVSVSYHLKGSNKDNWRADFMWLFKKENFISVKNGKYRDKK